METAKNEGDASIDAAKLIYRIIWYVKSEFIS